MGRRGDGLTNDVAQLRHVCFSPGVGISKRRHSKPFQLLCTPGAAMEVIQ